MIRCISIAVSFMAVIIGLFIYFIPQIYPTPISFSKNCNYSISRQFGHGSLLCIYAGGFIIVSGIQGVNFGSTANIRATISIKALKAGHYRIECIIDWSPSAVVWICLIVGIFVFGILWLVALLYLFVNPDAPYQLALDRIQGEVGMMSSVPQPAPSSTSAATPIAQADSVVQRLKQLKEMQANGLISQEEFDALRAEILAKL